MKEYKLEVWERVGFVYVKAKNKQEAYEIAEEYGYDSEECEFEPYNDGQYYEVR